MRKALLILALVVCFTCSVSVHLGSTQNSAVEIQGKVLWVAADKLVIAPYVVSAAAPMAISVDLSRTPLDEYAGLNAGDSVAVTGEPAPEGNRIIATSVRPLTAAP